MQYLETQSMKHKYQSLKKEKTSKQNKSMQQEHDKESTMSF